MQFYYCTTEETYSRVASVDAAVYCTSAAQTNFFFLGVWYITFFFARNGNSIHSIVVFF